MPRPYMIRADGTLLDRASATVLGRVWVQGGTWIATNPVRQFTAGTRTRAARLAWEDWRAPLLAPRPGS